MNDVLRGVLFSLGGNIAISIGDHLKVFGDQKNVNHGKKLYHHHKNKRMNTMNTISRINQRFLFGFIGYIVMITGQICNGYALAFAPQTLLACIGSIQFIMNLICSAILMSRPIKVIHIVGTFSIIIGCLIMIFGFSPKTDQSQLTVYTLFYNFNSMHYRNYLIVVVFIFLLSIIWQYFEANYLNFNNSFNNDCNSSKTLQNKKRRNITPRTDKNRSSFATSHCCIDPKLISGFFYSFSSAMTGTQSVVLGKTLAIIVRNYAAGKIKIFDPFDIFILFFILIVFLSFLITFAFWLYRRTESMVLFDTVFIAPMNQVMWLTFSTVAGGIYFHEFESANTLQWISLFAAMIFNYVGLYYLVPTAADQPVLIINMEKPQKIKTIDNDNNNINNNNIDKPLKITHNHKHRKHMNMNKDIDYTSDSINYHSSKRRAIKKKFIIKSNKANKANKINNKSHSNDDIVDNDNEHETESESYDDSESIDSNSISQSSTYSDINNLRIHIDTDIDDDDNNYEQMPLLSTTNTATTKNNTNHTNKLYQVFAAKRR